MIRNNHHLPPNYPLESCASVNATLIPPLLFNSSSEHPKLEKALRYYRATSVVLSLDAFINNVVYSTNASTLLYATVLDDMDGNVVLCVNPTVGANKCCCRMGRCEVLECIRWPRVTVSHLQFVRHRYTRWGYSHYWQSIDILVF
ncbi:hypothetical protein BDQ17DRAFT_630239 [Cyathus striatus]|nr:hypothetical protein BDQ17DRAFT_630239 [Cyathus striatus]